MSRYEKQSLGRYGGLYGTWNTPNLNGYVFGEDDEPKRVRTRRTSVVPKNLFELEGLRDQVFLNRYLIALNKNYKVLGENQLQKPSSYNIDRYLYHRSRLLR